MCQYEADLEEIDKEIKNLESKVTEEEPVEVKDGKMPVKRVILDREWDKPKLSMEKHYF